MLKADDSGKLAYHRIDSLKQNSIITGTREKLYSLLFTFFLFQFKLITKLQFNCIHITKSIRLTFKFFFVEFPSVADEKRVRTFLLNRSLICR